jgi:cytochrome P450
LLDLLVNAKDRETGEPLSDHILSEEIKTQIVTGHETTGRSLAFCLGSMLINSDQYRSLMQEIESIRGQEILKSSELSEKFPLLAQHQSETLRMYPSIYAIPRKSIKSEWVKTKSGDVHIRDNSTVILSPFVMQRREDIYGTNITGFPADQYIPARWSKENLGKQNLGPKDLPIAAFGGGARVCLGQHFYNPEFILCMRRFLEAFDFMPLYQDIENRLEGDFGLKVQGGLLTEVKFKSLNS